MDNALEALEKNQDVSTDILKSILNDEGTTFSAIKAAINSLNTALKKPKVMSKYDHLKKYIVLLKTIVTNHAHLEHLNLEDWSFLVSFLFESFGYIQNSGLNDLTLVRALSDVFESLGGLIKCYESCVADKLDSILYLCDKTIDQLGYKETSCHVHIMTCVRHLVQLGWSEAAKVGEQIMKLNIVRNEELAYECFVFACFIPQPWPTLFNLDVKMICSHEVEFLPASNLGLQWLRPSGDADLVKFISAIALSRSKSEYERHNSLTKRIKTDFSGYKFMAKAFNLAKFPEIDVVSILQWIEDLKIFDENAIFWALVVLGKSVSITLTSKATALEIWNKTIKFMEIASCSSGACFTLSKVIPILMSLQNIDKVSMTKTNLLLRQMSMTAHPPLTSGSLLLFGELKMLRILDDEWQSLKETQLRSWLNDRIENGTLNLITHIFGSECAQTYLQRHEFLDLETIAEERSIGAMITLDYEYFVPQKDVTEYKFRFNLQCSPRHSLQTLKDSLLTLAFLAHSRQKISPLFKSKSGACTADDLRAFVWFAGLASFCNWDSKYCEEALGLADWSHPDIGNSSVSTAVSLLKKPGAILKSIISGHVLASELKMVNEEEFENVLGLLNSYLYERSSWILQNLSYVVTQPFFLTSVRAQKLRAFLLKICDSQSEFSRLRKKLCECQALDFENLELIFSKASEKTKLCSLKYICDSGKLAMVLNSISDQLTAAMFLAVAEKISTAHLLGIVVSYELLGIQKLKQVSKYLKFREFDEILKISIVPLGLNNIDNFEKLATLIEPNQVSERAKLIIYPFLETDLDRNDVTLAGILEQIIKDCYFASDKEKSGFLLLWFKFLSAHRPEIPDKLLVLFFKNVCASVIKDDFLSLETLQTIASERLNKCGKEAQLEICLLLYSAGLKSFAVISARRMNISIHEYQIFEGIDLKSISKFIANLEQKPEHVGYDLWNCFIDQITKTCTSIGADESFCQLENLNKKEVSLLFFWTSYLEISDIDWLSILSRLCVEKHIDIESDVGIDIRNKSPIKALEEIYETLPFYQRRLLHPFLQRLPYSSVSRILENHYIPKDIFGKENWPLELNLRPTMVHSISKSDADLYESAQDLVDMSLWVLKYEPIGNNIVREIPQLLQNFIPLLVATAMKNTLEGFLEKLSVCIKSNHQKKVALALNVFQCCLNYRIDLCSSRNLIASACEWMLTTTGRDDYVRLGIMMAETSCFEDASTEQKKYSIELLRRFYSRLGKYYDGSFATALDTGNKGYTLQEIATNSSPWKQLEVNMVCAEVLSQNEASLSKKLESVGMWHLAQRFQGTGKYYNLEQAWWLHNWESVQLEYQNDSQIYTNENFGPIIGAISGKMKPNYALATLFKKKSPYINLLVPMFYKSSNLVVANEISRHGYEILCRQQQKLLDLSNHLKSSCEYLRTNDEIQGSFAYAVKLERLSFDDLLQNDIRLRGKIQAMSRVENAMLQWEIGQHSNAISSVKSLLVSQDEESFLIFDKVKLLCMLGTWSQNSKDETNEQILSKYFEEAAKHTNVESAEFFHHSFAKFCDIAYHDPALSSMIIDTERQVENLKSQCKRLQQSSKEDHANPNVKRLMSRTPKLLKSCKKDLEELIKRKADLTHRCIENYIASLEIGDVYPEDMGRLISLWLNVCDKDSINSLFFFHEGNATSDGTLRISVRKFVPWINQLASRLEKMTREVEFQNLLRNIITKAVIQHPFHSVWQLMQISGADAHPSGDGFGRKVAAKEILDLARKTNSKIFMSLKELRLNFIHLGNKDTKKSSSPLSLEGTLGRQSKYWHNQLIKARIPLPTVTIPLRNDCNYEDVPTVAGVDSDIVLAGGLSRPMIMSFYESDGKKRKLVLKFSSDDLRQDSLMQQVFTTASTILHQLNPRLGVRTYNVVPLDKEVGVIEFVENALSLQEVLKPLHARFGGANEWSQKQCREYLSSKRDDDRRDKLEAYYKVMKHSLPQMRHYWAEITCDPEEWFELKTRWCRSTAVMSILGYILGLGDRHCSNLLVDKTTGEVVHIDFGIAFDQGKLLSIPELVPFRLTRDIVDGMGVSGTAGVFQKTAEFTLRSMRSNEDRIMTVLEVLQHDTLYSWRVPSSKLRRVQDELNVGVLEAPDIENGQAKNALHGVRQKLTNTLNCEAAVRDLILQACNPANLAIIFPGWTPFY